MMRFGRRLPEALTLGIRCRIVNSRFGPGRRYFHLTPPLYDDLKAAEMNIFKVASSGKRESWSQKIIDGTGD